MYQVTIEYSHGAENNDLVKGKATTKTYYAAGVVSAVGGGSVTVKLPYGEHEFSREDGRWMSGPCLNYRAATIMGVDALNREIANTPQEAAA